MVVYLIYKSRFVACRQMHCLGVFVMLPFVFRPRHSFQVMTSLCNSELPTLIS